MNDPIIPRPGDADWPAWNARLQAGREALQHGVLRDSQLGISIRFMREYDAMKDLLGYSVFPPRAPWVQSLRDSDEPKVPPDVAAYLDDWFAK